MRWASEGVWWTPGKQHEMGMHCHLGLLEVLMSMLDMMRPNEPGECHATNLVGVMRWT